MQVTERVVTLVTFPFFGAALLLVMAPRGKPGYFFGEPLKLLTEYVPLYLSTAPTKKQDFWTQFNPVWAETFEQLDEDEKGELEDLEASYKDEKEAVQRENEEARRKHGRRKAVLQSLPTPSARLSELRARGADEAVSLVFVFVKKKIGFSRRCMYDHD